MKGHFILLIRKISDKEKNTCTDFNIKHKLKEITENQNYLATTIKRLYKYVDNIDCQLTKTLNTYSTPNVLRIITFPCIGIEM